LAHLCHLINRRREPLCPINGAVALFPLDLVNDSQKDELEFAAKSDAQLLREKLQLVCPLLVIVTGMDQDSGFREFMKRLGREKALTARFGKGTGDGSRAWNRSTRQELEALSRLACAAFEDFVYDIFKSRGALAKPGNTQLYKLLCMVRNNVAGPLERVLTNAFALKEDELTDGFVVGGCYFAGTGETEDRQAYVKGVLANRLIEELDEVLEWAPAAQREERRYAKLAQVMFWCDALMLISLVIIVVIKLNL
jgi:type VI protein secretion system component VasK